MGIIKFGRLELLIEVVGYFGGYPAVRVGVR